MEDECVNGPLSILVQPRHEARKAVWIMHFRKASIPLCDECKELMVPWEGATWEKLP